MRILIDTNVLLDVALNRVEFFENSAAVLDWAEASPRQATVAWHTISNLAYLLKQDSRPFIAALLGFVDVAAGDTASVRQALAMPTSDLEDALQAAAAIEAGANLIVTRNVSDFKKLPVRAITPAAFVKEFIP